MGKNTGTAPLAFDEMITADESPRAPYEKYFEWYSGQDRGHLIAKSRDAETIFRKTGITFAVYGHADSSEKLIPFDIIPRIISGREWRKLAQGIEQRVIALNAGTVGQKSRVDEMSEFRILKILKTNVLAPILCAKHALRWMKRC